MHGARGGEVIHPTRQFAVAGRNLLCDTSEDVIKCVWLRRAGSGFVNRKPFGIDEWNAWNVARDAKMTIWKELHVSSKIRVGLRIWTSSFLTIIPKPSVCPPPPFFNCPFLPPSPLQTQKTKAKQESIKNITESANCWDWRNTHRKLNHKRRAPFSLLQKPTVWGVGSVPPPALC